MENIYLNNSNDCKLVTVKNSTIAFLMHYSKSLHIVDAQGFKFENNLN